VGELDNDTCKAIYETIPGAKLIKGIWYYPVSTPYYSLPVVTLAIGTKQFTIHREDFPFSLDTIQGQPWMYGGIHLAVVVIRMSLVLHS
jgi:hypothetical protein